MTYPKTFLNCAGILPGNMVKQTMFWESVRLFMFLYTLALLIMLKKEYRQLSCYKIMTALGFYDMAAIAVNSLATGLLWLNGAFYCTRPTLIYVLGTIGLSKLCGTFISSQFEAIARVVGCYQAAPLIILFLVK
ncbi:unnamed protein product [Cylicostephanus goldi]|uniref:G-protein coupled receptors family 1 profile domain-containing protein n=1 Tax=Cylicostephanus goldi TaxID=71465 RepID=A0A3P6RZN1_CYLGO|nr:unnamed protein product [Cylicostephanus goldi]